MDAAIRDKNPNYKWMVLVVVMIGTLMGALDTSIVNVCIPAIMADFGSSVDDIEWVITAYMLAFATLMPLTAWLRDRIGHKTLYIASLTIFTIGSVLCGMAWNLPSLVGARVIQALGGGAITPTGMAMISEVFEPRERGKAMGLWGVGVIVGPAFGPTLGGVLTKYFGWRSIFMVNLPIGVIGFFMALFILHKDIIYAELKRRFDVAGFAFLSCFLVTSLLALSKGESDGWTSPFIVSCGILAFFSFIGFILVEVLLPEGHGIMDLRLFKNPVFASCTAVTFVRSVALFGGVFLLPLFLERNMGLDEIRTGLILLPGALIIGVCMPIAGRVSDKTGPLLPTIFGLILVAAFMFMYYNIDVTTSTWNLIKPTLVRGLGMGMLMAPVMAAAMNSVPNSKAGMASSILNLIQQVGGAVGIAILATVLDHRIHFHLNVIGSSLSPGSPAFYEAFKREFAHAHALGYSHSQSAAVARALIGREAGLAGSVRAFRDSFIVGGVIVLLALVPAFLLPRKPTHHAGTDMAVME